MAVGLLAYYGNRYYDDVEARTAEWVLLVLKNVLKTEQLDMWKPITFFLAVASACLMNTLCLLVACLLSYSTASTIPKTIYVSKHSTTITPAFSTQDFHKLVSDL